MEQDLDHGKTPLLVASEAVGNRWPPGIQLLLERGANIAARDHDGCTCLHWAFYYGYRDEFPPGLKASLILLVEAGANIHAVNKDNCSVSEYAIKANHWDLWQVVLRACGKDVDQIKTELREKGYALPGDPVYRCEECECRVCQCNSDLVPVPDSLGWLKDECYSEEDDRYIDEDDPQHDMYQPGNRDETDDFQDGSESDSDCSMGGAELSFGAL
jgi:hypothetical protein